MAKIGFHYGSEDDLKQALTELYSCLEFVLLERIDAIALDRFDFDDGASAFRLNDTSISDTQLANWEEGWAFGEVVELRWRKTENGQYHFRCLAADDNLPSQIDEKNTRLLNVPDWESCSFTFYLWGEKTVGSTDERIEGRIPRFLRYPVSVAEPQQATRVMLKAEEYIRRDLENGVRNVAERFVRFKTLTEEIEGGEQ